MFLSLSQCTRQQECEALIKLLHRFVSHFSGTLTVRTRNDTISGIICYTTRPATSLFPEAIIVFPTMMTQIVVYPKTMKQSISRTIQASRQCQTHRGDALIKQQYKQAYIRAQRSSWLTCKNKNAKQKRAHQAFSPSPALVHAKIKNTLNINPLPCSWYSIHSLVSLMKQFRTSSLLFVEFWDTRTHPYPLQIS